jgi:HD-like signal output (HDOD) protein
MTKHGPPSAFDLRKILSAAQLPALPQSAIRLLELSRDPATGAAEFAVPIESDAGLASQVLRFVNSSYFGFTRELSSVKTAITVVGIRTIRNFALWSAVFSLIPNPKCGPFDLRSLWQDSLRRALLARAMGNLLGLADAEEPFAAALLQDMAVPVLAKEVPDLYARFLTARQQQPVRLSALEQEVFGWSHAEVGGLMARRWRLPGQLAELIENHLAIETWAAQTEKGPAQPGARQNLVVALSALLPAVNDPLWTEAAAFEACYEKVTPPGSPPVAELLAEVDQEFAQIAPLLKVAVPAKSLSDRCREAAAPVA